MGERQREGRARKWERKRKRDPDKIEKISAKNKIEN